MSYALSKQLTHYQRVRKVLNGEETDGIPKGEVFFPKLLIERLTGHSAADFFTAMSRILSLLNADFVVLNFNATGDNFVAVPRCVEETKLWTELSDYFIFVAVDGVFWPIVTEFGFDEACRLAARNPESYLEIAETYALASASLACWCIGGGAHGVIITDDLAGSGGLFFSPELLRRVVFPVLKKLVGKLRRMGLPVIFHSDGKILDILGDIVELDVDGVHGLSYDDILHSKKKYPKITFMGGLDAKKLATPREESLEALSKTIISLSQGGRFIFSSDGGLSDDSSVETLKKVYKVVNLLEGERLWASRLSSIHKRRGFLPQKARA